MLSDCKSAEQLAASIKDDARPKASKSFFKRMRRSIRVALRGRSPRKQRRDANSKWRSLVRKGNKKTEKPIDDERMMAALAQKMERARLDNDSAELFQLDMPEDSDESTRAIVTPTASLEDADGATVIQAPYAVRRVSRDSQDDSDEAWGQFLDLEFEDDEPCSPSRSPAILIVPQLSASIDVPRPRAPLCF